MTDGTPIRDSRTVDRKGWPLAGGRGPYFQFLNDEPGETPDVSRFEPGRLSDFVRSARQDASLARGRAVSQWLAYWDAQGRHADALDDFDKLVRTDGVRFDLVEALDAAFEISRNKEGRSRAYVWLVRAMVENRGWSRWWSSDERFRARVRAVAQEYPEKWREFIVKTSRTKPLGDLENNGISVGFSRLVYFLVEVGENELAKRCAMEMVEVFRNEVSEQPLVDPEWTL